MILQSAVFKSKHPYVSVIVSGCMVNMKGNKVALMAFAVLTISLLMFGAVGDSVDEAYAAGPDDEEHDCELEVFDIALVVVMILAVMVLFLYRKKN